MRVQPPEKISFTSPPECPGAEIFRVDHCSRRFTAFHTRYAISATLEPPCSSDWRYRGKLHVCASRGLSFMEPGETHQNITFHGVATFRVLFLDPAVLADAADEEGGPATPHFRLAQTYHPGLYGDFVRLHAALENPSGGRLERQSRYAHCLRVLRTRCMEKRRDPAPAALEPQAVRRVRDYLREHYGEDVSLDDLVATSGLSRFHLVRSFRRVFGLAPHAYLNTLRVAHARRLLARRVPPAAVAVDIGFYDQSHLGQHFRRAFGISPGLYAKQVSRSPAIFPV